jgi:hypothetical protein
VQGIADGQTLVPTRILERLGGQGRLSPQGLGKRQNAEMRVERARENVFTVNFDRARERFTEGPATGG